MKVLLLNGSPHANGCTYTALCETARALQNNGIQTEIVHLATNDTPGCKGCFACRALGKCVIDD